ncbi:MAG: hypothetical protein Q9222_007000 [Ikaeria aurantiellina]
METPPGRRSRSRRDHLNMEYSNSSNTSLDTEYRSHKLQLSQNSIRSLGSPAPPPRHVRNENIQPGRLFSGSTILSTDETSLFASCRQSPSNSLHKSNRGQNLPTSPRSCSASVRRISGGLADTDPNSGRVTPKEPSEDSDKENRESIVEPPRLSFDLSTKEELSSKEPSATVENSHTKVPPAASATPRTSHSFRRWITHLRPQALNKKKTLTEATQRMPLDDSPNKQQVKSPEQGRGTRSRHTKTSSKSSTGLVDTVKEALTRNTTGTPTSRKSRRSNLFSSSNRSNKRSDPYARSSIDNAQDAANPLDHGALVRATQCQRILEELAESEASYVADLKVLVYAYFTLFGLTPSIPQLMSTQIQENVTDILKLHEDLLHRIQHVMKEPINLTASVRRELPAQPKQHHHRNTEGHRIATAVAGLMHRGHTSTDSARPTSLQESSAPSGTDKVREVAQIFEAMLDRLFVYEEYGATYELMLRDMASNSKSISNWYAFERSIEALVNSLARPIGEEVQVRKGLSFDDLLIKPIQRVCKYPLLFEELMRNTRDTDGAGTHSALKKVSWQFQEIILRINQVTNDQETQSKILRSWRLRDLLVFPKTVSGSAGRVVVCILLTHAKPTPLVSVRSLGYPILCGVLYIAYESELEVCGQYMLCALFQSHLLLAVQRSDGSQYDVAALINLTDAQIEKADDASFSWKLIFEFAQQLYELIFCACSSQEQEGWTQAIIRCAKEASPAQADEISLLASSPSLLSLRINSLGPIFGLAGSLTRRLSIQRAATVHSRKPNVQVIIRNTTANKENKDGPDPIVNSIGRSKSMMGASHVPILAPKRVDRSRMESSLSDVWSRDRLPFPGMSSQRGDHVIRASASSMMRRISRASISSTFSKRSLSTTSFVEAKPSASVPDLQKIGEYEDEHDARFDAYHSLRSTPGFVQGEQWKDEGEETFVRTGAIKEVKLSDATNQARDRDVSRVSAQTVRIESTEKGSPRIVRHRRSIPGGLLKGLSPEVLKAWRT